MKDFFQPEATTDTLWAVVGIGAPTILGIGVIVAVISYFLGCINGSILVSKYIFRDDVRNHGSKNAGLTNFYRTFGVHGVVGVLLSDILKAVVAVALGGMVFHYFFAAPMLGQLIATTFVLLGHMYPCMFGFHGGKGVLSGVSAVMVIDWKIGLLMIAVFIVLVVATRYVSLGSVCGAIVFILAMWFCYHSVVYTVLGAIPAFLLIFAHRSNISRLFHGNENKFSLHRNKADGNK